MINVKHFKSYRSRVGEFSLFTRDFSMEMTEKMKKNA